ncbi:MAG: hypothetical protein ACLQJR_08765 [Stellaceae bacterium]
MPAFAGKAMVENQALGSGAAATARRDYSDFTRNRLILAPELRHMALAIRMPRSGSIG